MVWRRASASLWPSGDSFGVFGGCGVCCARAEGPACRAFTGPSEATADAIAARRANSRRDIPALVVFSSIEARSGIHRWFTSAQRTVLNPRLSVNLAVRPPCPTDSDNSRVRSVLEEARAVGRSY